MVFVYYNKFCQQIRIKTHLDVLSSSIWLNAHLGSEKIYFVNWYKSGIHVVGDIVNAQGHILTLEEIKTKFGLRTNYLNYFTVRSLVRKYIEKNCTGFNFDFVRPHVPLCIRILLGSGTGSKNIYQVLQESCTITSKNEIKWNTYFNIEYSHSLWRTFYKICFYCIQDNKYIWFQYCILHKILGVRDLLFKTKISNTDKCRLCGDYSETIIHLLADCPKSVTLLENLISWIHSNNVGRIHLDRINKILGNADSDKNFWPLNFILTVTRFYIFISTKDSKQLNIYCLQNLIKKKYEEEEILSKLNSNEASFRKKWSVWSNIFSNI